MWQMYPTSAVSRGCKSFFVRMLILELFTAKEDEEIMAGYLLS
jgi:hypothetical protein